MGARYNRNYFWNNQNSSGFGDTIEIGAPISVIGNGISGFGMLAELALDASNMDMGNSVKGISYFLLEKTVEKAVEKGVNKILPGSGVPTKRAIGKYVMDKVTRRNAIKKLQPDFNLGTSIIQQGMDLKMKLLEKMIDVKLERMDKNKSKNNQ